MIAPRALLAIARADALERIRRYSFLVTLAASAWIGWLVVEGQVTMRVGDYAGEVNGAWAAALVAATVSVIVSLVGFWIVKNAVQRDRDTRVGEILAATPLTKSAYTLGKCLSNFAVLATIVVVLAAAAPVLVWMHGGKVELLPMVGPFVLIALPAMAVIAALAVLFETIGPLSGGLGNVLWFFAWSALFTVPMVTHSRQADMSGLVTIQESMGEAARAAHPDYREGFTFSIGPSLEDPARGTFVWNGLAWSPSLVVSRLAWFGIAALLALAAAVPFDRFGGDGTRLLQAKPRSAEGTRGIALRLPAFLPPVYAGELKLMLSGRRIWWWAVFVGLAAACTFAPSAFARGKLLPFAWLWPVLVWSSMGAREAKDATEELVFVAPRPLLRQLPSVYAAGVTVAIVASGGLAVRILASGNLAAFGAWLVGALFIPALALACGTWSGGSKLFEALYVVFWYVGPLQPVPALDFMGVSDLTVSAGIPARFAAATAILLAAAVAGRRWRLSR
ncbi:MAG TPA: hypothetical protein VFV19_08990 [Candidatus Polarisedimenticolaceae bacterium]|nr:hypothetical protein [Candidatus Polarisedimenticolaceae bacterium]